MLHFVGNELIAFVQKQDGELLLVGKRGDAAMTELGNGVIELTATDGKPTHIFVDAVVRIRGVNEGEASESSARTRIDWVELLFVREGPDVVADKVAAKRPSLACFALPNRAPVWADGKGVIGPVRTVKSERGDGVKSAIILAGKRQYLSNTPEEVRTIIRAAGGTPLPAPDEGFISDLVETFRKTFSPVPVWD